MDEKFGDTLDLQLSAPIQLANLEPVTVIPLSEPIGKHLAAARKKADDLEHLMLLISLNSGVPLPVVECMKQRDLARADDFFGHFAKVATPPGSSGS